MRIRGPRRRRAVDRGFVLSDHADWPGLLGAIAATGAAEVWVTHGYAPVLARWLREQGLDARPIATPARGEQVEEVAARPEPETGPTEVAAHAGPEAGLAGMEAHAATEAGP
jgi:putative mRNA 3-end processing factor